jgi:hypothetical protein
MTSDLRKEIWEVAYGIHSDYCDADESVAADLEDMNVQGCSCGRPEKINKLLTLIQDREKALLGKIKSFVHYEGEENMYIDAEYFDLCFKKLEEELKKGDDK